MEKIEIVSQSEKTMQVLTHWTLTDEFEEFLVERGRKIKCVSYGYYNEFDLIVYEV